jgi:uncharacterized protein (TIGR03437 family)
MTMQLRKTCISLLTLFAAGCSLALAQTSATFSYNGPSLPIYYDSADIGTVMNITVPAAISITSITTTISVNYPYTGDLNVFLYGPDGTRTILVERNCGGQSTLVNMTFSDSAQSMYSNFCPAQPGGTFSGNQPLSNYKGKLSAGVWSLFVENNGSNSRFGTVDAFSVTINGTSLTPPTISAVGSAVSAQAISAISPGELIGIEGTNLGPTPGVIASGTTLPTTLGGVQVTINNQAIPLYFVSATLIAGVVPYQALPGNPAVIGGQVTVSVTYNGTTSNGVIQNLASSTPALFTTTSSVSNVITVNAVNSDGTSNSTTNRAAAGTYVSLYAQGLGQVSPSGFQAGTIAPLSQLFTTTATTFASITGQPATVTFSGLAPATISAYQVNVLIPPGTPSGQQPIYLYNSVGHSQDGVYIWIK